MAKSDVSKALTPLAQGYRGKVNKHEGTGLGLPLTKRLVEIHDGTLPVERAIGEGTTMTGTLPKAGSDNLIPPTA